MSIRKEYFGVTPNGEEVFRYVMQNENRMSVAILNLGGVIQALTVPDKDGNFTDILGGFDNVTSYYNDRSYQGAIVGRFANRIKGAAFTLDGVEYKVTANAGNDHMHGGARGFTYKIWNVEPADGEEPQLKLHYTSPDGEEGFPGTMQVDVTYTLKKNNALSIRYHAVSDKKTVVNLTNHSYFNLGGYASGKVFGQELWIDADTYLPLSKALVPTGEILPVAGTPFDFTENKTIGRDFDNDHPHFKIMGGYDVCLNFKGGATKEPVLRAVAYDPISGREMKLYTDQPAVQLYTANGIDNPEYAYKGGLPQSIRSFFCLETQGMPDGMHHDDFASPILDAGESYDTTTEFVFSVR